MAKKKKKIIYYSIHSLNVVGSRSQDSYVGSREYKCRNPDKNAAYIWGKKHRQRIYYYSLQRMSSDNIYHDS